MLRAKKPMRIPWAQTASLTSAAMTWSNLTLGVQGSHNPHLDFADFYNAAYIELVFLLIDYREEKNDTSLYALDEWRHKLAFVVDRKISYRFFQRHL